MNKYIILLSIISLLMSGLCNAQAPASINYQAVLRNTDTGEELMHADVFLVAKFIDGLEGEEIVYQEEHHTITTNIFGMINVQLGEGYPVLGSFAEIPWSGGDIWLELDVDAGNGLVTLSKTKFSSVPYALYASNAPETEPDGDGDSTNEIQDLNVIGHTLKISGNPNATSIDLSQYENDLDGDTDPTNEIQDLSITDNFLSITGKDSPIIVDLNPYVNITDGDGDSTNEIQDLSITDNFLSITGKISHNC